MLISRSKVFIDNKIVQAGGASLIFSLWKIYSAFQQIAREIMLLLVYMYNVSEKTSRKAKKHVEVVVWA